jgi:hypothetical protein
MTITRSVYVISDLHIGGIYPDHAAPHEQRQRGFRMMTRVAELAGFVRHLARLPDDPPVELVINGDFIDFLAEEKGSGRAIDADRDVGEPDEVPRRSREPDRHARRGSRRIARVRDEAEDQ